MLKILLIFIFIGVNLCLVVAMSNFQIQNRRSANDLPGQKDLDTFLNPIKNLAHILANNVADKEIYFPFGIFITNVHLERVLLDKGHKIPVQLRYRIKDIVDRNKQNLIYFREASKDENEFTDRDLIMISKLYDNSTYWMHRLKKMKYEVQPTHSYSDLEIIYSKWQIYKEKVHRVWDYNPSPKISDVCLLTLSLNPRVKENSTSLCPVAETCYHMLTEGTNFGYALCHRLFFLMMAHLGRGCFIWSRQEDDKLMQKVCTMAYAEAEYIAMNGYDLPDLMLEFMCFCATDGRVQFLRRTWLYKIFDFQNNNGCFKLDNHIMIYNRRLAKCNSHITSLASATYAAAVRFILEKYY